MQQKTMIRHWQQWLVLFTLSCLFLALFEYIHLPAALVFGPMLTGILMGLRGASIRISPLVFKAAQSIIGCMLAIAITPSVINEFLSHWLLLVSMILSAILCSSIIGIVLTRRHIMPGSTAIWGTTPGAASAMIIIAEDYGADIRLVAFMQYFRVLLVAITASLVAWFIQPTAMQNSAATVQIITQWFPAIEPFAFVCMIGVAITGAVLATWLRFPAPALLGPLVFGGCLHGLGWIDMQLPYFLLAISFAIVGWNIGLTFERSTLNHVAKALPVVTLSIVVLMLFCGFLSWILVITLNLDPLTAYLANTPGGLEAVAAIATSRPETHISFIMTLQTARLILLAIICPALTRRLANRYHRNNPNGTL